MAGKQTACRVCLWLEQLDRWDLIQTDRSALSPRELCVSFSMTRMTCWPQLVLLEGGSSKGTVCLTSSSALLMPRCAGNVS
jgi:hypothetical protein